MSFDNEVRNLKRDVELFLENESKNKIKKKNFKLTDNELLEIAGYIQAAFEGDDRGFVFENAKVYNGDLRGNGVTITFNEEKRTGPKLKVAVRTFGGDLIYGAKTIKDENNISAIIVGVLYHKYGDSYGALYAKNQVMNYYKLSKKGHLLKECNRGLTRTLSFIGKQAENINTLILRGVDAFDYDKLVNMPEDEEC